MQRGSVDPFFDLDVDPFEEDSKNALTSSKVLEDDDRDFEEIANILNSQRFHDPIIAMRSMQNDTPCAKLQEKIIPELKKPIHTHLLDEQLLEEKMNEAQKKIKYQLLVIRNKVKRIYNEIKAHDKNALNNPYFVDYILLEMAGISKDSNEYNDFKNTHYHTLVMCLVKFMSSYIPTGLNRCTRFSAIQLAFRGYLYEKILPENPAEKKEMKSEQINTTNILPEEHLNILNRLSNILQHILMQLRSCLTACTFFRKTPVEKEDGRDHNHVDSNAISL